MGDLLSSGLTVWKQALCDAWVTGFYDCCQMDCKLGQQAVTVCLWWVVAEKVGKIWARDRNEKVERLGVEMFHPSIWSFLQRDVGGLDMLCVCSLLSEVWASLLHKFCVCTAPTHLYILALTYMLKWPCGSSVSEQMFVTACSCPSSSRRLEDLTAAGIKVIIHLKRKNPRPTPPTHTVHTKNPIYRALQHHSTTEMI